MCSGSKAKKALRNNMLAIFTIAGVIIGIGAGVGIRKSHEPEPHHNLIKGIRIPGDLLLRGLHMLVLPLVMTSLILGIAGNSPGKFNKQAGVTFLYYITTTIFAAIIGLLLVSAIDPGKVTVARQASETHQDPKYKDDKSSVLDVISDMIKNIVPKNMISMSHMKTKTVYKPGEKPDEQAVEGMNMLGVIAVSIAIGVIVMANKEQCKPFLDFCQAVNIIVHKLTKCILWYSPIGIMFLVMAEYSLSDVDQYASQIGKYIATVLAGLAAHLFIVLPSILMICTGRNPLSYYKSLLPAMATAFGTASSTVTIPLTMKCVKKAGVSADIVDFVAPVGATVNMDGTALYEAVACLFIAQLSDRQLTNPEIVITGLTATVAAIGAAGIPSAGLVTLVMVLNTVDLSTEHIALILTVDWFIDRFRTLTNVVGDAVGCAVIEKFAGSSKPLANGQADPVEYHELTKKDEENGVGA